MKYKYQCCDCGQFFDEPAFWEESRGEWWGMPAYETVSGCPHCGGDYQEVEEEDEDDEEDT